MRIRKKQLINSLIILIIISAFSFSLFLFEIQGAFKTYDDRFFDYFHIIVGEKSKPEHVALVEIDNETFLQLKDEPMAFWGPYFAKVIKILKKTGVKTIGIDFFFTISIESWFGKFGEKWEGESRMYDLDFRRELAQDGMALVGSFTSEGDRAKLLLPINEYIYSLPNNLNDIGLSNLLYDDDGIVRHFTHKYFNENTPPYLSLASLLTQKQMGSLPPDSQFLDFEKVYHINYYGPPRTFPSVSFSKFLEDGAESNPAIRDLKGKVIVIALGEETMQDLQQTPYSTRFLSVSSKLMSGGEVHANIIETIISNDYCSEMKIFQKLLYILIFSLISALIFLGSKNIVGIIYTLIFFAINIFVSFMFFNNNIYTPGAAAFLNISINYFLSLGIKSSKAEREKAYIRGVFEKYVSDEVVKKMIESGESPSLGGEMKEVTVLFSDIRNFTTISEMLEPDEVVEMLNRYFSVICERILKAGGTVDKFIGDAIMVIFGSPLYYADHAKLALKTALEMNLEAKIFKQWLKERFSDKYPNLPEFKIGIGLHTGKAIIGNIGSLKRFEFTAIGDTVNTASRLEGLSKEFEYNIIVSRCVLNQVIDEVLTGKSVMKKVKGKHEEIEVIEFIGFKNV